MCSKMRRSDFATCTAAQLVECFFYHFNVPFELAIRNTLSQLPVMFSEDLHVCMEDALFKMSQNLIYAYRSNDLAQILHREYSNMPFSRMKENLYILSDILFAHLHLQFNSLDNLKLSDQHYDLYLD